MAIQMEMNLGTITISEDVVAAIAKTAATECYGIVGLVSTAEQSGFVNRLKQFENNHKGVVVETINNLEVNIDLYVVIQFGTKISVVAKNIVETVKYNVEHQTGLKVLNVNLHIENVRVQS